MILVLCHYVAILVYHVRATVKSMIPVGYPRLIIGTQKGTVILTTTHMDFVVLKRRRGINASGLGTGKAPTDGKYAA